MSKYDQTIIWYTNHDETIININNQLSLKKQSMDWLTVLLKNCISETEMYLFILIHNTY